MPADRLLHQKLGHSEKVSSLSDFEFRVWVTYELASDDYGVMRFSALAIQAANDALAEPKKARAIQAALDQIKQIGLVDTFVHQRHTFCFQLDWQNFQRVKHPRDTAQPCPPPDKLAMCTPATRKLFSQHPMLRKEEPSEELPEDFGNASGNVPEDKSELGSLACGHARETANGYRLTANGERQEAAVDKPNYHGWFEQLCADYPEQAVTRSHLAEQGFFQALSRATDGPFAAWARMQSNLQNQIRGHQWRVKRMIPRLDKWLRDGLWEQRHDEQAPVTEQLGSRTARTLTAATDILKGGTH